MTDKGCLELVEKGQRAVDELRAEHDRIAAWASGVENAYREGHCAGRYFVTSGEFSTEEIDWQKSDARAALAATPLVKMQEALEAVRKVSSDAPELNMFNYDEEDVARLNEAMIDVHHIVHDAALSSNLEGG